MLLLTPGGCNRSGSEPGEAVGDTEETEETEEATDTEAEEESDTDDEDEPGPSYEELDPARRLVRISTALRGRRPSLADMDRVEQNPDALGEIVDGYLRSEAVPRDARARSPGPSHRGTP